MDLMKGTSFEFRRVLCAKRGARLHSNLHPRASHLLAAFAFYLPNMLEEVTGLNFIIPKPSCTNTLLAAVVRASLLARIPDPACFRVSH